MMAVPLNVPDALVLSHRRSARRGPNPRAIGRINAADPQSTPTRKYFHAGQPLWHIAFMKTAAAPKNKQRNGISLLGCLVSQSANG